MRSWLPVGGRRWQFDQGRQHPARPDRAALRTNDWTGAAVTAANGLAPPDPGPACRWCRLLIIGAVIPLLVALLCLWSRRRRRKRHEAEVAAAKRWTDRPQRAGGGPRRRPRRPVALDRRRRRQRGADQQQRTGVAVEEFGQGADRAVRQGGRGGQSHSGASLQRATATLDDEVPETPAERRDRDPCHRRGPRANRELETQTEAFHQLRDLVINAGDRLDALTRQLVDVTARLEPSEQKLAQLHSQFARIRAGVGWPAMSTPQGRVGFADQSRLPGAASWSPNRWPAPQTGSSWTASGAPNRLCSRRVRCSTRVDSAATDIPQGDRCVTRGDRRHPERDQPGRNAARTGQPGPVRRAVRRKRDAAVRGRVRRPEQRQRRPAGAFTELTQADADLTCCWPPSPRNGRPPSGSGGPTTRRCSPRSRRCGGVGLCRHPRRGSVGRGPAPGSTRPVRQLQAAQARRSPNITEAIAHANGAAMLAAQAQQLANNDVQNAQRGPT